MTGTEPTNRETAPRAADQGPPQPSLLRVVSRGQVVALSVNSVIGSGIFLLPGTAAALLGFASLPAMALAAVAVLADRAVLRRGG